MGWGGISSMNIPKVILNFESRTQSFLINFYGVNEYGFGINRSMLRYNSADRHTFFSGGVERVYSLGAIPCGGITANETSYIEGNLGVQVILINSKSC